MENEKNINIVIILTLVMLAVIFLSSCSLNIKDTRVTSGKNIIEVENIDLKNDIFTADIYINQQFIQHYQIKSGESEENLLQEKNITSFITEHGSEDGIHFVGNIKMFAYLLKAESETLHPKPAKFAVIGPCFIEIDGKMQILNIDFPKNQYLKI